MLRVITAGRADTCHAGECVAESRTIAAGEKINYAGPGAVSHAVCPPVTPAGSAGTPRRGRSYRGRRYGYSYERCTHEDYPCCGC